MNCLISGATGTVGGLVIEILLSRRIRPRGFARDESKARARFGDRVDVAICDLSEPATLGAALRGIDSLREAHRQAVLRGRGAGGRNGLRVVGRPAISFDTWVRENVAEFR